MGIFRVLKINLVYSLLLTQYYNETYYTLKNMENPRYNLRSQLNNNSSNITAIKILVALFSLTYLGSDQ